MALASIALAFPARAEVPNHNPDLDHRCKPGFQWSRGTVACEQANCPSGARRTDTLGCSCGEAWGKPFRTCRKDRLATHCVAKGQDCDERANGFDPITGGCKDGFEAEGDGTCAQAFPARFTCRVLELDGSPVANAEIVFAEKHAGETTLSARQNVRTDARGAISVAVGDRRASELVLRAPASPGYPVRTLRVAVDRQPEQCVLRVMNGADAETFVKDRYIDLLGNGCVSPEQLADIRAVSFDTTSPVDVPQYDAEGKVVKLGSMDGDWSELERTLFHEFGHAISDSVIDPGGWYVKGFPLAGKYVGGSHDNWKPNEQRDGWGPDIDAEQLAFEEGLADFLALIYYRSLGQSYQSDLDTDARAIQALRDSGADTGARTESVVTRFLAELYADELGTGPAGAARVMGDLIKTITHADRNDWFGTPARTIREFIASKARRNREETDDCSVAGADLKSVSGKFGFAAGSALRLDPTEPGEPARARVRDVAITMGWQPGQANVVPKPGQDLEVEPGQAAMQFEIFDADFPMSGATRVITFSPDRRTRFRLDGQNAMFVSEGFAHVRGGDVATPHGRVEHKGTEYVVEVTARSTRVAVATGAVVVAPTTGAPHELAAGEAAEATSDGELTRIDAKPLLEDARAALSPQSASTIGVSWPAWIIHVAWIALLGAIPIVWLVMRRKG
jgi:hypothetical protein